MRAEEPGVLPADVWTASGGSAAPSPEPADDSPYWLFYEEVAAAQLAAWAPEAPARVLDLSGGRARFAQQLGAAGHDVLHVNGDVRSAGVTPLTADARSLRWLRDGSVDAVLAEARALSFCLAAEVTVEDLLRVLKPGGRLLLVVESLLLGLARLADQGRWAELADVPSADVVLVPTPSGAITRCFWPEELQGLLTEVGFEVEWVRPRSVLSPSTVERALAEGREEALRALVKSELALAQEREGESTGIHLVASARKP
ncbi:MAG: Methyltransferase type 11 [Frankiales bacterium]|nr:Methyltransferase type 11 [Frankiales bacterium]